LAAARISAVTHDFRPLYSVVAAFCLRADFSGSLHFYAVDSRKIPAGYFLFLAHADTQKLGAAGKSDHCINPRADAATPAERIYRLCDYSDNSGDCGRALRLCNGQAQISRPTGHDGFGLAEPTRTHSRNRAALLCRL